MTLGQFIDSGGIPAEEAFFLYHPQVFGGLHDGVVQAAYLNRNIACGFPFRLRRKLMLDHGVGRMPVRRPPGNGRRLFWGQLDGAMRRECLGPFFRTVAAFPGTGYEVVVGMSDDTFGDREAALIPGNVERVFAMNVDTRHPKVATYPLGRDFMGRAHFGIRPKREKRRMAYSNFSLSTHPDRGRVLELLRDKPFVDTVRIWGYGEYNGYPMTNQAFLEALNDYAFCVCPRGAGYDTYRLWDSLHLGVIPIVVREAVFHDLLAGLPVLFLDALEQFADLTEPYLEKVRSEMLRTEYNFSTLAAGCWKERLAPAPSNG